LHAEGRAARAALDAARRTIAGLFRARAREIVFTGGGSEATSLGIIGAARAARRAGRGAHVVTVATEHRAVLAAVEALRDDGFETTVLGVDAAGRLDPAAFVAALRPDTVLASVMLANNEIGTLQPVAELTRAAHARGVIVHTDAIQAPGRVALDVAELGVDLLSLSAHKCYGPAGVGALYVREGTPLEPLVAGGPQEAGARAGTENVAGIAGFARAFELAAAELAREGPRLTALRDRFEAGIRAAIPGTRVNGAAANRLPGLSSIAFDGTEANALLVAFDLAGVAVSAGSACAAGAGEPSHVIAALGGPDPTVAGTIRFSAGRLTSEEDVERLLSMVPEVVRTVRDDCVNLGTQNRASPSRERSEVRF
jgi:cysteine desulfurase